MTTIDIVTYDFTRSPVPGMGQLIKDGDLCVGRNIRLFVEFADLWYVFNTDFYCVIPKDDILTNEPDALSYLIDNATWHTYLWGHWSDFIPGKVELYIQIKANADCIIKSDPLRAYYYHF